VDLPVKDQALKCCKVLDIAGIIWESVEVNANMSELLEKINSPEDLKKLSLSELKELAAELRELVVDVVSAHEGHLAPNLGAVELTLALHYVFDSPRDKLIWDVGHQAYIHKIITGRRDRFHTIRKLKTSPVVNRGCFQPLGFSLSRGEPTRHLRGRPCLYISRSCSRYSDSSRP